MNAAVIGQGHRPYVRRSYHSGGAGRCQRQNAVQDGSLVMGNLMLAAASLGLGSCWINRAKEEFETEEGKALLRQWGIEGDWVGVGHCILGYPAADPKPAAPRKPDYIVKV
ncbi:MAG: nitroreductase family protein [Faecalibacterium prausnitzii]